MIKYLSLIATLIVLTSCKSIGFYLSANRGEYKSIEESVEIPFTLEKEMIIIQVKINNEEHRFLFDTGAPNIISLEIAAKLKEKRRVYKVSDSGNKSNNLQFCKVPKIEIGNAIFENTFTAITDLNISDPLSCFHLDGLIGANLMQKANLQIDYLNKKLRFFDEGAIQIDTTKGFWIPIIQSVQGSPFIYLTIGDKTELFLIDTGFNYFISSNQAEDKKNTILNKEERFTRIGATSAGIFGDHEIDTSYIYSLSNFKIGGNEVQIDGRIQSDNMANKLIGNLFLKNYTLTFDWKNKKVFFEKNDVIHNEWRNFGFSIEKNKNKIVIGSLTIGGFLHQNGVQIGDEVTQIGTQIIENVTVDKYCELINEFRNKNELLFIRILSNEESKEFLVPCIEPF